MTNDRFLKFQDHFDEIVHGCQKFAVFARGIEFQKDACEQLDSLLKEILAYKDEMISEQNEYIANTLLSLEEMVIALKSELKMIIELKNDNPDKAWDYLIEAQMATRVAMQSHPNGANHLEGYVRKLSALERLLFPNQLFFSIGLIAIESKCSICDSVYGECNHLIGKAYMGKHCYEIVTKWNLEEVSIVDNPASKKCRATTFNFDGINRNLMTYRPTNDEKPSS